MSKTVQPEDMQQFVQLSALLTGFNADVIAPSIDPVNLKEKLYSVALENTGQAFTALLTEFAKLSGGKPVDQMNAEQKQTIGNTILSSTTPEVAATAAAINKMWYLGSWYQPFDFNGKKKDLSVGVVISDQAYVKGLSWQVMQSHAMGNSTFTYGYWTEDPPALEAFTGNQISQAGGGGPA